MHVFPQIGMLPTEYRRIVPIHTLRVGEARAARNPDETREGQGTSEALTLNPNTLRLKSVAPTVYKGGFSL
jgi:hypothetical protein